jgi:uncharacterized protein (TIGR03086 family)
MKGSVPMTDNQIACDKTINTEELGRAFASTRAVLERVRAEQMDAATPCASWDVRALINHFIGTAGWAAAAINSAVQPPDEDYAADALASYDQRVQVALDAFSAPGVPDRAITLAFGQYSGAALMNLVATEQFTHGWDLARAIGHRTDLDPGLAVELLSRARFEIPEAYRGSDGQALFGPIIAPRVGASAADELAAFLGRVA